MHKNLFIHIGTHKTGTSAIQDFLRLNRKPLSRHGVLYPQKSRRDYYASKDGEVFVPPEKFKNYRRLIRLARRRDRHIIVSSETFSLIRDVRPIRQALGDIRPTIICYLRRQDNFIQSFYNQAVKNEAEYRSIAAYEPPTTLDYDALLDRWAVVFGRENVKVRPYEKDAFKNGDLVTDFLSLVGLDLTPDLKVLAKDTNPRLPGEALEYMRLLNSLVRDRKKCRKIKTLLIDHAAALAGDTAASLFVDHFLLPPEQRQKILSRYADSNQRVARNYLGREDGRLFREPPPDDHLSPLPEVCLTDDKIREMTNMLCRSRKIRNILHQAVDRETFGMDDFTREAHGKISRALARS